MYFEDLFWVPFLALFWGAVLGPVLGPAMLFLNCKGPKHSPKLEPKTGPKIGPKIGSQNAIRGAHFFFEDTRVRPCVTAKLPVFRPWFWTLILLKCCARFLQLCCFLGWQNFAACIIYLNEAKCESAVFFHHMRAADDLERRMISPLSMQSPTKTLY